MTATSEPSGRPDATPLPQVEQPSDPAPETFGLGRGRGPAARPAPFPIDPVCGMPVDPATARHTIIDGDRTIYFCCPHCKATYVRRQVTPA